MSDNKLQLFSQELEVIEKSQSVAKLLGAAFGNENLALTVLKINWGREMGLSPVQSASGIHIIKGKPAIGSGIMATLIKQSGKYDYRVVEHSATTCKILFFEHGKQIGESEFTMKDAKTAGITNNPTWSKFPKNMLFSRALSNGAKWYCPDIFGGSIYTPEELEDIEIPQNEPIDVTPEIIEPIPEVQGDNGFATAPEPESDPSPKSNRKLATQSMGKKVIILIKELFPDAESKSEALYEWAQARGIEDFHPKTIKEIASFDRAKISFIIEALQEDVNRSKS